jgi:WD40 repeat protein
MRDWLPQIFFLRDGSQLMWMAQDKTITFMDVETGKTTNSFREPALSLARASDLSPDGSRLAQFEMVRSDKGDFALVLRLYDLKARKTVWTVQPQGVTRMSGYAVQFTPDGRRLLTLCSGGDVRVWDVATGDELRREKVPEEAHRFELSPDGKTIALGTYDVYVWDWQDGQPARKIDRGPRRSSFDGIQFSGDGKTVYVSGHGGVSPKGYDVGTGHMTGHLNLGGRADWFSFSPDGMTLAMGRNQYRLDSGDRPGEIILKDAVTKKEARRLTADPARPAGARWSKDGSRLASFAAQRVIVWDVQTGKRFGADLPGHDGVVSNVAFAADGRVFTTAYDRTVRAWDPATGKSLLTLMMDTDWVPGLALSPDGSLVAASGLRSDFQVWDSKTGKELFRLLGHGRSGGVRKVRFSADEQTLLSWGDDWSLRSFDTLTGKLRSEHRFLPKELLGEDDEDVRMQMELTGAEPRVVDLGPDGKTLVMARGKDIFVYEVTGQERFRLEAGPMGVEKLALSADGKWLATAGRLPMPGKAPPARVGVDEERHDVVTVWDMATATAAIQFRAPTRVRWGVLAFTPDGRQIVTGSWGPELAFWDAKTGKPAGTIDLPHRAECVAFDPPGKRLVVGFTDTTALVYDVAAALKPAKKE